MMVLPTGLALGSSERQAVEAHANALGAALDRMPENSADAEAETLVLVTKLMMALPGQRTGEAGAEATGEAYQTALDDLPPWSVAAAIRNWYRGNSIPLQGMAPHNYTFRPGPAALRKLAFYEAMRVRGRARKLKQLLSAVPLIEYSDDHCADMRAKLRELPIVGPLVDIEQAREAAE